MLTRKSSDLVGFKPTLKNIHTDVFDGKTKNKESELNISLTLTVPANCSIFLFLYTHQHYELSRSQVFFYSVALKLIVALSKVQIF